MENYNNAQKVIKMNQVVPATSEQQIQNVPKPLEFRRIIEFRSLN